MAISAIARRALTFLFVLCQSYFKWPTEDAVYLTPNHHLAGLILARGGSKGIPHKNMANLNDKPLIYWSLKAMLDSAVFTSIWISTDDPDLVNWVEKEFKKSKIRIQIHSRAEYTATDEASSIIAVQEFLKFHPEVDAIGLVQATSPFLQPEYLKDASILLRKHDSVFSVFHSKSLRWKNVDNSKEPTQPLNFDPKNRPRRQEFLGEMVENGMFYFTMRDVLVNENVFQGSRPAYIQVPKLYSLEIDGPLDLELAQRIMKQPTLSFEHGKRQKESSSLKSEL